MKDYPNESLTVSNGKPLCHGSAAAKGAFFILNSTFRDEQGHSLKGLHRNICNAKVEQETVDVWPCL